MFLLYVKLMAVRRHWGTWNQSYNLQFVVYGWWDIGVWFWKWSRGWFFILLTCVSRSIVSFIYFPDHLSAIGPQDIRLRKSDDAKKVNAKMLISEEHIGNQYRYSLRVIICFCMVVNLFYVSEIKLFWYYLQVYLSILYLRIPQNFCIILRGKVVEHHVIAHDLKYQEFIMYRPQIGGLKEVTYNTSICLLSFTSILFSGAEWHWLLVLDFIFQCEISLKWNLCGAETIFIRYNMIMLEFIVL